MAEMGSKPERTYGKVIINLENCILPVEKLTPTPSMIDGLDEETEMDLRILGCELIQTAGILLKLPQVAMATAQVIFQRFYYSKSMVKHNMETLAMACINLASKIEEAPRRIRDVVNVFHHIRQKRHNRPIAPLVLDQNYINLKNNVIKAERRVLKELGFCVHVKHPHKMIVTYLQILECERNVKLVQTSWNYMNDSLRTDVFVRYPPETIACACIYLSARQLMIPLPSRPPWYALLGATEEQLQEISLLILHLYARPKKSYEELDKIVEKCRGVIQKAKLEAKGQAASIRSAAATPNPGFSPASKPNSPRSGGTGSPHNKMFKRKMKDEGGGSAGSYGSRERNGREGHHTDRSHSRSPHSRGSRSVSPHHNSHSHSRSPSHHSSSHSSDRYSRSMSGSPRERKSRYESPHRHKRHEDHRSRDRERSRNKHSRKRKHSRSYSRSRSRSRSRTPRAYKHRHSSPHRDRHRHRYARSHSEDRRHKSKRDRVRDDTHRRSRDRHRR